MRAGVAASRRLARRPAYPLLTALTLGLGIAASTAIFSVVDAVLLRPLPIPDPERVVAVYATDPAYRDHPTLGWLADRGRLSVPELEALVADRPREIVAIGGYSVQERVVYPDGAAADKVRVGLATSEVLPEVLKVETLLGRHFTDGEARSGEPVVVLSEGFWERAFSGDRDVVGRRLRSDVGVLEVVGVVPQLSEVLGWKVDVWMPLRMRTGIENHFLPVLARLAPGVTAGEAGATLERILDDLVPAGHVDHRVRLLSHHREQTRDVRGPLLLLWAAAGLLLLVACASATAITLADAVRRRREFALRRVLGAGPGQLLAQLAGEGMVVSTIAAGVGIALAGLATRGLLLVAPNDVPRITQASLDGRALAFGVGITLVCAILASLAPGPRLFHRLAPPGRHRGRAVAPSRLEGGLVMAEVTLAIVLLAVATLLARTVFALNGVDTGMARESLLALRVDPSSEFLARGISTGEEAPGTGVLRDAFYRTLADELEALPGVRGAALTRVVPFHPYRENNDVEAPGAAASSGAEDRTLRAERRVVSGDFFEVAGIPIVEGRPLRPEDDRRGAPGRAVVSEGLAAAAWPDGTAIGRHLRFFGIEATVVGIARNVRDEAAESTTRLAFYVTGQHLRRVMPWILIRTDVAPELVLPAVREHVRGLGPDVAITELEPVSGYFRAEIASRLYRARLVIIFSALALALALAGVLGVSARHVRAHTHEIGVRKALGARDLRVFGSVVGRALRPATAGAIVGLIAVLWLGGLIEAFLWGVEPHDPISLLGALALTLVTALVAASVPARRALKVDPARALRAE